MLKVEEHKQIARIANVDFIVCFCTVATMQMSVVLFDKDESGGLGFCFGSPGKK